MALHQELHAGMDAFTVHKHQSWIGATVHTSYFPRRITISDVRLSEVSVEGDPDTLPVEKVYTDWKDCWENCPDDSDT